MPPSVALLTTWMPCLSPLQVMEELAAMPQLSHLLCQLPRRLLDPPGSLQHSLRLRSDGGESALTEVGEEQRSAEVTHGVGWQASKVEPPFLPSVSFSFRAPCLPSLSPPSLSHRPRTCTSSVLARRSHQNTET